MKTTKLIMRALCVAFLAAFGLLGCEEPEIYTIDAPADLQARIDSIAAAKAGVDTGDTTYIDIATGIVGAEDNSAAWWTAFSDYFTIPANKLLRLEFVNHGSGVNNWNNWNLAVANVADRDADDYSEYFVLRSDAYGWGNADYDGGLISHNYPDTDEDGDIWDDFLATMQGAYVTLEVDHSTTGYAFVTATAVGTNGTELVQTYQHPVSATEDIVAFLVADASHFEMKKAYLLPSQVTTIEDVDPVSIEITGAPEFVEIGDENFWRNSVATVTFADGSSTEIDSADLSFSVIPDMSTLGEKTVVVTYSKTKQGAFTQAVSTIYNLTVTNSVVSIEVTNLPELTTYYFFRNDSIVFDTSGLEVTATYADASTAVLDMGSLKIDSIAAVEGPQDVKISYQGAVSTVSTTVPVTLVKGIGQVGASDLSTPWWTEFSDEYTIPSGESKTIKMYLYSSENENYHSPSTILRKTDLQEYAVVRMDNHGWDGNADGNGYDTAILTSDWNWEIFTQNLNGSYIEITITNNGDNTADVRYDVTYSSGETHFQEYAGLTIDSSDLNSAIVIERAYVVIVE